MKRRLQGLTADENEKMFNFYYQTVMIPSSSEITVFKILQNPVLVYTSIYDSLEYLESKNVDISFVYGDQDWLDTQFTGTGNLHIFKFSNYFISQN